MLNVEATLDRRFPGLDKSLKGRWAKKVLNRFAHQDEINAFIRTHPHLQGAAFIQKALEFCQVNYHVSASSQSNIPAQGRVIIVANHPIGTLDGLALLHLVKQVRKDVKVLANDLLDQIEPLQNSLIPVNNMAAKASHTTPFKAVVEALEAEQAVIVFPAGVVSRFGWQGVRDGDWKSGFLKMAHKTRSPILPIHVDARNSALFYALSMLHRPLGTLMLVHEMFNKPGAQIGFTCGKLIPWQAWHSHPLPLGALAQTFKQHVYRLKQAPYDSGGFSTITTLVPPACRQQLREDLKQAEHLMTTPTGLDLYLVDYVADSALMQELGRVRELTFRAVGEGTGNSWDLDQYDRHYRHLILWDDRRLEIVGGYRLGECQNLIRSHGRDSLYANHMFELRPDIEPYLCHALELGRCFVQPRYWQTRALDYLWYGMGHYLARHPEIRYLFGSISLSNSYSSRARELIVSFYNAQFGTDKDMVNAKCPFTVSAEVQRLADKEFRGEYRTCFKRLNRHLKALDETLPMLFKHYVELCEGKGCQFLDFNLAPDFNNAIGALMMLDLSQIKPNKQRYLKGFTEATVSSSERYLSA